MSRPDITLRPITAWPRELIPEDERRWSPFTATWSDTRARLLREAEHLGADTVVLQLAVRDRDIRQDGHLRANLTKPAHPGVIVVLPDVQGGLSWACDEFGATWTNSSVKLGGWKANVRAIALSLERLRLADLYGVLRGGHYAGFRELGSGIPMDAGQPPMTVEEAARFITRHSDFHDNAWSGCIDEAPPLMLDPAYRQAAKRLHPDAAVGRTHRPSHDPPAAGRHRELEDEMNERDDAWFDEFCMELGAIDEDKGRSAVRLIAEMFADRLIWRDGDNLVGRQGASVTLDADDQHLVRRIEDAAAAATRVAGEEARSDG